MKPLPRENTFWEFLRAHIFVIFGTCFTVSSRINILSIFHRILSVLGLHFGTMGTTFGGHFSGLKNMEMPFYIALLSRGHLRPLREKGGTGRHLGGIWETSGRHLRGLGDIWEASGRSGKHLGGIWEASRRHLGGKGPEEAQRRLGLKKLIDFCSQMQHFH